MKDNYPFQNAKWISPDQEDCQSPIIERIFFVEHIQTSTLYITGLGYFEVRINGRLVTPDLLIPVASDYERRNTFDTFFYPIHDTFTHRIYYCRYEVTRFLQEGENILQIQLGNGWYRQTERVAEGDVYYGSRLKTIYRLVIQDADAVVSDGSEQWHPSEIVENQLFIGEVHDARIGEMEHVSRCMIILPAPDSILTEQNAPADRVIRTIEPRCIFRDEHHSIWDAGENISGVVRVLATGKSGEVIRLRFAEKVNGESLNFASACGAEYICRSGKPQIMEDIFICGSRTRTFVPKFVWHSFRYFEIEGPGSNPEVLVIHSDTPINSTFHSDSEGWNYLYDAFLRTQLDNMHGGFPSDCPHRERLGYTGDGQAASAGGMLLLDSQEFYRKWIQDILDCQDIKSGHVQHTAPFMGGGGGPGGWGCAIAIVPWNYYRTYGEIEMLSLCYPAIQRWIDYLQSRSENGLLIREEEGGWCLGEWCTPEKNELPIPFVNTCFFIHTLDITCCIAQILGRPHTEIEHYRNLEDSMRHALRNTYYDPQTHSYCNNYQGAHAYAAWVGLADDVMISAMAEHYRNAKRFDTGFLGTAILCEVLFEYGFGDVVHGIMENDVMGTFLYQKRQGATTIWEYWHGGSNNHPMFGGCVTTVINYLLGIRPAENTGTYQHLLIAPCIPAAMHYASGSITTPWGIVSCSWKRKDGIITFSITIPENVTGTFQFGGNERLLFSGSQEFSI